jgi:hypothetical protein
MAGSAQNVGSGCLFIFGIPFAGMGLLFLIKSLRSLDDPNFQNPWIGVFMGGAFVLIGGLLMWAAVAAARFGKQQSALQAANPGQPWMWRHDWAQGRAAGRSKGGAITFWILGVFLTCGSAFPVYFFFQNAAPAHPGAVLGMLLFPLIGIGILIAAIRRTLRALHFGNTFLQLQTVPAVLGKNLKGTIDVRLPYPLPHGINLALTCVNRVTTGSGDSRSTYEHIRWQDKQSLPPEQIMAGPAGSTIPVEFAVPRDLPSSDNSNSNSQILWILRAEADIPGVNFDETYEVPVFETAESPSVEDWRTKKIAVQGAHPPASPTRPTVQVSPAPEGGTQFYFPAGRNRSAALSVTFFLGLFGGAEVLIFKLHAPLFFPIVFGFFDVLLFLITLNLWFGTARVVASSSQIVLQSKTLGVGGTRQWACGEITAIRPKITMQSGGSTGIPYYTVTITANGRESQLGNALADRNEAEWICGQLSQIANLKAGSVSA